METFFSFQYFIADIYFLSFFCASNILNDFLYPPPPPGSLLMVRPLGFRAKFSSVTKIFGILLIYSKNIILNIKF